MILSFHGAGYSYDAGTDFATRALSSIDLDLEPRMLTLVLGATGSGKSTLLRLAAGLLIPTEGSVTYGGIAVDAPLAGATPPVGLVFQSPETQLFAETVEVDVAFGPRNRGSGAAEATAAARRALIAVGMDPAEFAHRSPFSLSGGEARRVAIAGVLAMQPGLMLFDEPTAGLDARGRAAVRDVVLAARNNAGVVVVTHDAEEFLGMADRVLLLTDGEVTFFGDARELIESPYRFTEAGLRIPEVLRAQMLAEQAGHRVGPYVICPRDAARSIARAGEEAR